MDVRLRYGARLVALAAAFFAAAAVSNAQEPILPPANNTQLRVLFFNTHLLPAIAQSIAGHRGQDDYRTQAIAAQLHRYDLIGLCEVFEAARRREIVRIVQEQSQQAYRAIEPPKAWGRHLTGSGLLLLSRLTVEGEPHFITYKSASRVITSGIKADGLAAKGAIHVRLRIGQQPDDLADCFLTHLESVSAKARAEQVKELAAFVAAHAADHPMIVMGDMNVAADFPLDAGAPDSEYRQLVATLQVAGAPLVDAWPALLSTQGGTSDALAHEACRRIDYLFFATPPPARGPRLEPVAIRVVPFLDAQVKQGSLSDHAGVECEFSVAKTTGP